MQLSREALQHRDALLQHDDRRMHRSTTVMFYRDMAIEFVDLSSQSRMTDARVFYLPYTPESNDDAPFTSGDDSDDRQSLNGRD